MMTIERAEPMEEEDDPSVPLGSSSSSSSSVSAFGSRALLIVMPHRSVTANGHTFGSVYVTANAASASCYR